MSTSGFLLEVVCKDEVEEGQNLKVPKPQGKLLWACGGGISEASLSLDISDECRAILVRVREHDRFAGVGFVVEINHHGVVHISN